MIYETDRTGQWRLMKSNQSSDSIWKIKLNIPDLNELAKRPNFVGGSFLSYDGNFIFFTSDIEGTKGNMDIWISEKKGSVWAEAKNIGNPINTSSYEGFPSVSADGRFLYFMRGKEVKLGRKKTIKYQLFVSERQEDRTWGEPILLPENINKGIVECPRIMVDGISLIFSAIRQEGKGGFDLYKTTLQENKSWTEPENLDFVNSPYNEKLASIPFSGDILYYTCNEFSSDDIYSINIPEEHQLGKFVLMRGKIQNEKDKEFLEANITIKKSKSDRIISQLYSTIDGDYVCILKEKDKYEIELEAEGFFEKNDIIEIKPIKKFTVVDKNIELSPSTVPFNGIISDIESEETIKAKIAIKNIETNEILELQSGDDGKFETQLEIGLKYQFMVSSEGFENSIPETIDLVKRIKYQDIEKNIALTPRIFTLIGNVVDIETKKPIKAKITISDLNVNKTYEKICKSDGSYSIEIRKVHILDFSASTIGYMFYSELLIPEHNFLSDTIVKNAELSPLKKDVKAVLNNILFDFNSYVLQAVSYRELNRVADLMKNNPRIKVEISAHTDSKGSNEYNDKLSQQRANSVVNYLINYGISKNRFIAIGHGELKPISPNDTEKNRAKNRRVEFKIVD
jgi:outer membrane protein OmpA-like peptidoglycan-associated protein